MGLLLLLAVTAGVLMLTPFFNLQWVDITGNEKVTSDQILKASEIAYQTNVFRVNVKKAAASIGKIPYVETVSVHRKLPGGIRIKITESVPVAYMPFGTSYVLIDGGGKLLESLPALSEEYKLPVVTGIALENFELGASIQTTNPTELKAFQNLMEKLREYSLLDRVSMIDISNPDHLTFQFDQNKTVQVGDAYRLDYKLMMLQATIEELAPSEAGAIDLTIEGKAIFSPKE